MSKTSQILLICSVTWRLISVYIVQTSHVPDEYWQSLEVAHHLAFNYGYLTWEWNSMIRSYIYPFLISILYRTMVLFNLDSTNMLVLLPRIFQAILSGYADYRLALNRNRFKNNWKFKLTLIMKCLYYIFRFYLWTKSKWAVTFLTINWYWYYCATRTLTNTLETALTIVALSMFPWKKNRKEDFKFLWICGFVCAVRPTMIVPWTPICIYHIFINRKNLLSFFYKYLVIGMFSFTYSTVIDSYCYGQLVISPWEFFRVNILNNVAGFYGKQHFFWYFIFGLPVLAGFFTIYLPFVTYHILLNYRHFSKQLVILISIVWTMLVYSLLGHKEFRFLLPILPMIIYICTCTPLPYHMTISKRSKKILIFLIIVFNLLPGIYFSLIHQRGPLDTVNFLQNEFTVINSSKIDLMFLTPCHAMPLYSHIHKNVSIRFLTCEPNLHNQENYLDDTDHFFRDPSAWLNQTFSIENSALPSIIIVYDNVTMKIADFLKNYQPVAKFFNAHFPQLNYGRYIFVYKHNSFK